ncbi:hypothetical protein [Streptomyces fradiae]|uniref:hypothetical protein n=1 Tax=Streptomyces fradiae TaxID=1906 RepID=UPI0035140CA4
MMRQTLRALCAASLALAPLALGAAPAHAQTSCTVNGVPVTGPNVNGTPGSDIIVCSLVESGESVNGGAGSDYITLTGPVNGLVYGGPGRDSITAQSAATVNGFIVGAEDSDLIRVAGTVTNLVAGGSGNDYIQVATNEGVVTGDSGLDVCRIGTGNPAFDCEV